MCVAVSGGVFIGLGDNIINSSTAMTECKQRKNNNAAGSDHVQAISAALRRATGPGGTGRPPGLALPYGPSIEQEYYAMQSRGSFMLNPREDNRSRTLPKLRSGPLEKRTLEPARLEPAQQCGPPVRLFHLIRLIRLV